MADSIHSFMTTGSGVRHFDPFVEFLVGGIHPLPPEHMSEHERLV